jgi:hypothetical protein
VVRALTGACAAMIRARKSHDDPFMASTHDLCKIAR